MADGSKACHTSPRVLADATATEALGAEIGRTLRGGEVILLHGELGAGKTTLTRGVALALGCDPDEVSSPTFVTLQHYLGDRLDIIHVDAYRLGGDHPAAAARHATDAIGLTDHLGAPESVVIIEWPDRLHLAPNALGERVAMVIHITLEHAPEGRRATIVRQSSSPDSGSVPAA